MAMRKSRWEQEHDDAKAAALREVESHWNTLGVPIIDYPDDAHYSLWGELFILYYSHSNNKQASCDKVGIKRSTLNRALIMHPEFAKQVALARSEAIDRIEFKLYKMAESGDLEAIKFYLKGVRRERFGDKQQITHVERIDPAKMTTEELEYIRDNGGRLLPQRSIAEEDAE